ncbi:hypothetical protein [Streptomyces brasiliensis]|uniref:Secreted protein n=1 Tax=Streptomyces brasiliensis TaxID=1954 RepID=A0A917P8D9_9ACTN|nr:hypothetical protein [Streptomyces brasiliensis]GGJ66645.1 hypothetical protein GCM10010121_091610 [Streptomyces brasiliensis]
MSHRKPRTHTTGRTAMRLGMLTTVCLTGLATVTPAGAVTGSRVTSGVGIALDEARSSAGPRHRVDYDDEFTIHQLGTVVGAGVRNRAIARSTGCSIDRPCRSVAVSFQIVTATGAARLNASNTSSAVNDHCEGCQTFAGAYQFIVSTPYRFTLSQSTRNQLAAYERRLAELESSRESIDAVKGRADSLAAEVVSLLQAAVAAAPRGATVDPLGFRPTVTLRRHID